MQWYTVQRGSGEEVSGKTPTVIFQLPQLQFHL